jgi:MFS transporter, DHA1 family, tetracycline resistance protein
MFLTAFIDLLGSTIVIPVLAPLFLNPASGLFREGFLVSHKTLILGLLLATYPLFQFFGAPLLGALSDRTGRKVVLVLSLLGTVIGYLMFGIAIAVNNIWFMFLGRMIDGFTGGNLSTIYSAIADVSDEKEKTKNFGLIGIAFGVGFVLGPFIGGVLSDNHVVSWFTSSTPFWFQTVLAAINMFLVILYFPETLKQKLHTKINMFTGIQNISKAFKIQNLKVMFFVGFLLSCGFNLFTQFFAVFLVKKFELTQYQIGSLFAYVGIWIAISQGLILRIIVKRFKPTQIIAPAMLAMTIGFLALTLPHKRIDLYLILPLVAVLWGLIQPNLTSIISSLAGKDAQGEILGINQSVISLSNIIPPIIDGIIIMLGVNVPIIGAGVLTFISLVIFVLYYNSQLRVKFSEL